MREIVLDTETTGLDPTEGHRVIELGMVELENHRPTGKTFHAYFNPERDIPKDSFAVHGLSTDFLKRQPRFIDRADEILQFIGDAPLIAHNASFDHAFLNKELKLVGRWPIDEAQMIDSRLLRGGNTTLDALCKRFRISLAGRDKHGALVDAQLLAQVYLELVEARQGKLGLIQATISAQSGKMPQGRTLPSRLKPEDIAAHRAFVATLGGGKDKVVPIWFDYLESEKAAA